MGTASPPMPDAARISGPVHLTHVDGMRALAAFVVFVNHAYAQVWNAFWGQFPPASLSLLTYSLVAGHLSVTVFIVISGFCLMLPVVRAGDKLRGGVAGFFKRRARRILPPYYGAVAFCLVCIWTIIGEPTGSLWDVPIQVKGDRVALISHLLLFQDLFGTSKINYVFWSIAVEWHIYFLFPLLVWGWRRVGPRFTVAGALAAGYALRIGFANSRLARASPHYVGLFALGMMAAYVVQSDEPAAVWARERFSWRAVTAACVALVCGLSGYWGWQASHDRIYVIDLPTAVAAMGLLVLASRDRRSILTRLLSFRPIVFIGTFSYSVYLIHAPLLQIMWQYALRPAHLGSVAMFAALLMPGGLLVLAVSYGFFRLFEEPFMRQPSRRLERPSMPLDKPERSRMGGVRPPS
jgi:peptidoglycan/LPS O-acetylase OafA/YrhL